MIYINLYKDYQELYPNWSIPPDVSAGDSLYRMHFISKFKDDLAMWYNVKPHKNGVVRGMPRDYVTGVYIQVC